MAKEHEHGTRRKDDPGAEGPPVTGEYARGRLLGALPVSERSQRLNGVQTAVLEGGSGPPIVLLHGPGAYGAAWLRVIPDLVKTHRVIAPDLPGHGASQASDGAPDVDLVLGWLGDLIERACPTPPVLVGLTLGGAIAARFAARRGERIKELVLVDALGLQAFHPAPEFGEALERFISDPTPHTHDGLWKRCSFDLDALRGGLGEHWEWIRAYNLDRAREPGLRATQHGLFGLFGMPSIPPAELAGVAVPTTLIWGRHDLATPLRVAEAASVDHGWPLHVIENAADEPPMDQPRAFVAALRSVIGDW